MQHTRVPVGLNMAEITKQKCKNYYNGLWQRRKWAKVNKICDKVCENMRRYANIHKIFISMSLEMPLYATECYMEIFEQYAILYAATARLHITSIPIWSAKTHSQTTRSS